MTQEEKAQNYDEALERARKEYKDHEAFNSFREMLVRIFPELRENENEKMWKLIKKYAHCNISDMALNADHITREQLESWLKKQGEKKPADREYTFKAIPRLLEMIEPTNRAKTYCQKLIDSLIKEGYVIDAMIVGECLKQMNGEKVAMATMDEQKPAEWSKEDVGIIDGIIMDYKGEIEHLSNSTIDEQAKPIYQKRIDFLNRLKSLYLVKQEWSAEDEFKVQRICKCLNEAKKYYADITEVRDCIDWLKLLKSRVQPKQE